MITFTRWDKFFVKFIAFVLPVKDDIPANKSSRRTGQPFDRHFLYGCHFVWFFGCANHDANGFWIEVIDGHHGKKIVLGRIWIVRVALCDAHIVASHSMKPYATMVAVYLCNWDLVCRWLKARRSSSFPPNKADVSQCYDDNRSKNDEKRFGLRGQKTSFTARQDDSLAVFFRHTG